MNISNLLFQNYKDVKINNKNAIDILNTISHTGDELKLSVYLIGGPVRDILFGKKSVDIDILINAKADLMKFIICFIKKTKIKNYEIKNYPEFKTATVKFNNTNHIDFALTRKEIYPYSGCLPVVKYGNFKQDISRRDFTINTLAVCLNKKYFGELIDLFNGLKDIKEKRLMVLHKKSFQDDPTRLFRAIRFIVRYNLKFDKQTFVLFREAIKNNYLNNISKERLKNEFILILKEENFSKNLQLIKKYGIINFIHPELKNINMNFDIIYNKSYELKLALLLYKFDIKKIKTILSNLNFDRYTISKICDLKKYLSGYKIKNLPEWTQDFLNIINFKQKSIIITGKDLIKFGLKPGYLFNKIINDVNTNFNLNTYDKIFKYIKEKYA